MTIQTTARPDPTRTAPGPGVAAGKVLDLLERARSGLLAACHSESAGERYTQAHLAALRAGAALLAGEAALRVGAGRIALAVPASTDAQVGVALPEAGVVALPDHADDPFEGDLREHYVIRTEIWNGAFGANIRAPYAEGFYIPYAEVGDYLPDLSPYNKWLNESDETVVLRNASNLAALFVDVEERE